ncbi:MAG TPA: serine hydrolase, partial [Myxococcota bacterium]|nr:serine hydrolase [Myxococcota bacterium]
MRSPYLLPLALLNAGLVLILRTLLTPEAAAKVDAPWVPPPPRAEIPAWLPTNELSMALPSLDAAPMYPRGPHVAARAALVVDLDREEVLWGRRPDVRYPVASLTKIVSALTLVSLEPEPDLGGALCVTPEIWPTRPGARSRFETGVCHSGWEYLGAALVHSDNRGAMAIHALAGVTFPRFVQAMDEASADLGMTATWADPTGLEDNNLASARDMVKAVVAVASHPLLAEVASSPTWSIERRDGSTVGLVSTNRLRERYEVLAAKTGYTDTARYNFVTVVQTRRGGRFAVAVLGSESEQGRFTDADRMIAWADSLTQSATAAAAPSGRRPQ